VVRAPHAAALELRCPLPRCRRSFQLRDALRVGCIGLSSHFFTLTMEKREMLKLLDDEMRNFCILVEAPKERRISRHSLQLVC
jgi:hypothetical protein